MTEPDRLPLWPRVIAITLICFGASYLVMVAIEWVQPASDLPVDELFPYVLLLSLVLLPLGAWMDHRSR